MDKTRLQNVIMRRYMGRFVIQTIVGTAALAAFIFACILLAAARTWYASDPLYHLLNFIREYILIFTLIAWVCVMLGILLVQWRRIARSLISLSEAVEQIASGGEYTAQLPQDLHELQELLRQVQLDSLRSEQIAQEAEQRKNDLVVYLAHDLKTPLTSVLGYLTLLRDERELSPELQARYLAIATGKAQRLEDLINEFFEITRFNLKGLVLEGSTVNLSRMLEQVIDEFRPLFAPKNLRCRYDIQPDIELLADAGKLERVVDNLLRNAVSYSHNDTEIQVWAEADGEVARLRVRNYGNTIAPHKLERIFEQFYRVDSSRSGADGGSGLGLAIAREIVELHRGAIQARSEDGVIEFEVTLPLEAPAGRAKGGPGGGSAAVYTQVQTAEDGPATISVTQNYWVQVGAAPPAAGEAGSLEHLPTYAMAPRPGARAGEEPAPLFLDYPS